MLKTHIFRWFRIKKEFFYRKICTLLFVTLSHMNGLSSFVLQKTWNAVFLSNIYILMHNNTFAADFLLKTWNFHCTRRSTNWEFRILQIINFLKTTKMIPECEDLLRLLVCASWSCIGVSWTYRDIALTTFWLYIPHSPLPPVTHTWHT